MAYSCCFSLEVDLDLLDFLPQKSFITSSTEVILIKRFHSRVSIIRLGAVVMAQLAEWSLPIPVICGSNSVNGKILY